MIILGIETSCDETAVAIVDSDRTIRANLVLSQLDDHKVFGGVVPEIAARAHMDHLDKLIAGALAEANLTFSDLDGIAATCGPGLIGGVMVGMMAGKAVALAHNIPFIGVNHLEAHALTPRLTDNLEFPYLLLLISGGHTQILVAEDVGQYHLWGTTQDDAIGECFDKCAKIMGLPFPGGPHLEKAAQLCKEPAAALARFPLPRPMMGREGCDFSFSGLKNAVKQYVDKLPEGALKMDDIAPLAYSFEQTMAAIVSDRCAHAITRFLETYKGTHKPALVASGGVAANKTLRAGLTTLAARFDMDFKAPPVALCSDNGAMVAWAGVERLRKGLTNTLDMAARPRWPLDQLNDGT